MTIMKRGIKDLMNENEVESIMNSNLCLNFNISKYPTPKQTINLDPSFGYTFYPWLRFFHLGQAVSVNLTTRD